MKRSVAVFSVLVAFAGVVLAERYEDRVVSLEVPEGFEGPIRGAAGPQATVVAYTKPYRSGKGGTLFQITEYDLGEALRDLPEDRRGEAADDYLAYFLGGVERRRTSFSAADPERIVLGGAPAARVTWTGEVAGQRTSGVMYCVVVGTVVVSFHTQDLEGSPAENRAAEMRAFESVTLRHGVDEP
jgi:hypothetical protein